MWARSPLAPCAPLSTVSAQGRVQGNHPAATSSLLISPPKVTSHFAASGNSDDEKKPLTKHLPRPASEFLGLGWVNGGGTAERICSLVHCALVQFDTSQLGAPGMEMPFDSDNTINSPHLLCPTLNMSPQSNFHRRS